ncbi:MAG TPA: imidazole glycerol phosphate synthase subunit HisH [Labilithrix sp.]|nr:imidazole glycerol phosphate synthase subunit HisH [Labilithrix sp.]
MRIVTLASGVGNVRSVVRALERVTVHAQPTSIVTTADPEVIRGADVLVVPGQGSFGAFAAALDSGLRETLLERIRAGVPYLGICLGLQILFDESEEAPGARGLGVLRGSVRRLTPGVDPTVGRALPLPHMGWNRVALREEHEPGGALVAPAHYYFAHSYAAAPAEPDVTLSTTTYGAETFTSSVQRDNVVGIQFHPEKSQSAGLSLLERFFSRLAR